jgi:predicted dehydrogenase
VRRERGCDQLGVTGYATLEEMLAADACDAVAIFTPHSTHRELVELSAAHHRHVFCEKAMAVTSEDCARDDLGGRGRRRRADDRPHAEAVSGV